MRLAVSFVIVTLTVVAQETFSLEQIAQGIFGRVTSVTCSVADTEGEERLSYCFSRNGVDAVTASERINLRAERVGLVPDESLSGGWVSMSPARGSGTFVRTSDNTLIIMRYENGVFILEDTGTPAMSNGSE